jgi:protein TonB
MYFSRYIIISILTHLLFAVLLAITSFTTQSKSTVFDVAIVEPFDKYKPPVTKKREHIIGKKKPPLIKKRRRPPEKNLLPETIFGKGTGQPKQGRDTSDGTRHSDLPENDNQNKKAAGPSFPPKEGKGIFSSEKEMPGIVPPSSLFDKSTIEKFARKGLPVKKKGLTFDTSEFKHRGYLRMLKEKIEHIWKYPKEAARLGISGDLIVKFKIKRDGKLGKVEVSRTSGHRYLDEAVIRALKAGEPYWPLPDDWKEEDLEITGHFLYVFGGIHIM